MMIVRLRLSPCGGADGLRGGGADGRFTAGAPAKAGGGLDGIFGACPDTSVRGTIGARGAASGSVFMTGLAAAAAFPRTSADGASFVMSVDS